MRDEMAEKMRNHNILKHFSHIYEKEPAGTEEVINDLRDFLALLNRQIDLWREVVHKATEMHAGKGAPVTIKRRKFDDLRYARAVAEPSHSDIWAIIGMFQHAQKRLVYWLNEGWRSGRVSKETANAIIEAGKGGDNFNN